MCVYLLCVWIRESSYLCYAQLHVHRNRQRVHRVLCSACVCVRAEMGKITQTPHTPHRTHVRLPICAVSVVLCSTLLSAQKVFSGAVSVETVSSAVGEEARVHDSLGLCCSEELSVVKI